MVRGKVSGQIIKDRPYLMILKNLFSLTNFPGPGNLHNEKKSPCAVIMPKN